MNATTKYIVGDKVMGKEVYRSGNDTWFYVYDILQVKDDNRFGKPNQLLTVKITTNTGNLVDNQTMRWADQLY